MTLVSQQANTTPVFTMLKLTLVMNTFNELQRIVSFLVSATVVSYIEQYIVLDAPMLIDLRIISCYVDRHQVVHDEVRQVR